MLTKVGESTWLRTGLINELTVIFNEHLDMKPYSVYVCTENENFERSEHDTEEEAVKAMDELARIINCDPMDVSGGFNMEENTKERICYLLAENYKLRNLNDELKQELALKDEIIRKQICMMSEGKNTVDQYGTREK